MPAPRPTAELRQAVQDLRRHNDASRRARLIETLRSTGLRCGCGYDLSGHLVAGLARCPECGEEVPPDLREAGIACRACGHDVSIAVAGSETTCPGCGGATVAESIIAWVEADQGERR